MVDKIKIQKLLLDNFTVYGDWEIDDDGLVSASENVIFKNQKLKRMPVSFKKVDGNFFCDNHPQLRTLEGAPHRVEGSFSCGNNSELTSLLGAPKIILKSFWCSHSPQLISLKGAPESVGLNFSCFGNPQLESLVGAPKSVGGSFQCNDNPKLKSLDHLPEEIGSKLLVTYTKTLPVLRALVAKQGISFIKNNIEQEGDAEKVAEIVDRYKGQGQTGAIACAAELAKAGLKANARW
jgi:hypothetical protein